MYKKVSEIKVIKVTHEVSISYVDNSETIIKSLQNVPSNAQLIDISTNDADNPIVLKFEEEINVNN